jgi:hypothetical protein
MCNGKYDSAQVVYPKDYEEGNWINQAIQLIEKPAAARALRSP